MEAPDLLTGDIRAFFCRTGDEHRLTTAGATARSGRVNQW
jgi:hypothetical protein